MKLYYLDYCEKYNQWHIDEERREGNKDWFNICCGRPEMLEHLVDICNIIIHVFHLKLNHKQVRMLARCTPYLSLSCSLAYLLEDDNVYCNEGEQGAKKLAESLKWVD